MMRLSFATFMSSFLLVARVLAEEPENAKEIINELNKCAIDDRSEVNKCFTDFFIEMRPKLAAGIKEMDVPPLDEMFIDRVDFPENSTLIQGKAYFQNLIIKRSGNYVVKNVTVDIPKHTITLEYFVSEIEVDSEYNFDGNIQVLPVKGEGNANVLFTDVDGVFVMIVEKNGTHLNLASAKKNFGSKTIKFRLENIMGGKDAGEALNALLNENAFEVIKELFPVLSVKFAEAFATVFTNIVNQFSSEIFTVPK